MRDPSRRETEEMKNHRSWEYETAGGTRDEAWAAGLWRLYINQPDGIWIEARKVSWLDSRRRRGKERWVLFHLRWARCCCEAPSRGFRSEIFRRCPNRTQEMRAKSVNGRVVLCKGHCQPVYAVFRRKEMALLISHEYCTAFFLGNYSLQYRVICALS